MSVTLTDSPRFATTQPKLSVLIPFYRDDASQLVQALNAQSTVSDVELLLYDDGTQDAALTDIIKATVQRAQTAVRVITNPDNHGRAVARNALFQAARAEWVLFLDADMLPARDDFLQNYLTLIATSEADVIFGGFQVESQSATRDRDLHRALSEVSDCLPLSQRQAAGPQFVASSNLCVRRDVLASEPFDPGFSGWGWEDSEWAARIAKRFTLLHADNQAIHLGLETTDTLLSRFATSGPNYRRFVDAHPDLAPSLALYRISRKLGHVPGQSWMRPILKALVKFNALPLRARLTALKLWRASHYAEALS